MKRFLLMTALGLAVPGVALCETQPWAQITDFAFGAGGTITIARDGPGPDAHWVAVDRSLLVVSEVIEKYRWTESRACPGLDQLVDALGPLRAMKRSKPRLEGPRDGEFVVRFLADGKQPLKELGGKGHGAEEEVLRARLAPVIDAIQPCWAEGKPPPETEWRDPPPAR